MILIDPRDGPKPDTTSIELKRMILAQGIPCEIQRLDYGDACFEGNGPKGKILIGLERKALHDMLHCIDDARYSDGQMGGMRRMYAKSFLLMEGNWKPHNPEGHLMEGFSNGTSWGFCRPGGRTVLASKLTRYLISVQLAGVIVTPSKDLFGTAYNICDIYHYFQKRWSAHTSMIEVQKVNIATFEGKPNLVHRWAANITDIGAKHSLIAKKMFRNGRLMANAEEKDWLRIPGIGVKTARSIVKEIMGYD